MNENIFAFVVLTAVLGINIAYLKLRLEPSMASEARAG
jgi:hypothetical protein